MTESIENQITDEDVPTLAKAARLKVSPERHAVVGTAVNDILRLFDALDSIDLGETPPTNAFDPRWRDLG